MVVWWFWHLAKPIQIQEIACKIKTSKHGSTKRYKKRKRMRQAIIIKPVCRDSPVYLYHSLDLPPLGYLAFGSCNCGNLLDPMGATPRTPSPWSCCAFWCQALKTSMLPRTGIFGAIYFNISTFQHQVVDVLLWIPNFLSTPSLIPDSGWYLPSVNQRWNRVAPSWIAHFQSQKSQHVATGS